MHNLRGFAIVLVIVAHSISALSTANDIALLRSALTNATVLFVVISGYFFSLLESRYSYYSYLVNKFKNVVFPYLFLSLPAALLYVMDLKQNHPWIDMSSFSQLGYVYKYLYLIGTGAHLGPLWFIPMIVLFFFTFPILRKIKKTRLLYIIFLLSLFMSYNVGRPELNNQVFQSFVYFLPAYLFGMILQKNEVLVSELATLSILLLPVFCIFTLFIYYFYGYNSSIDNLLKLVLSLLTFAFFHEKLNFDFKPLSFLAGISFYLYFVHGYFISLLRILLKEYSVGLPEIIIMMLVFICVITTSALSYFILRKVFYKRRRFFLGSDY